MVHGERSYLKIVAGTDYAACMVWQPCDIGPSKPLLTEIKHIGDDPLYEFLPETGKFANENKKINAIHRKPYRKVSALSREFGEHICGPFDDACDAQDRKRLTILAEANPNAKTITIADGTMGIVREIGEGHVEG